MKRFVTLSSVDPRLEKVAHVYTFTFAQDPWFEAHDATEQHAKWLAEGETYGSTQFIVAFSDDVAVGAAQVVNLDHYLPQKFLTPELEGSYLKEIFIHPDFQGQGFGSDLMGLVEEHARTNQLKDVVLRTHATSEGLHGFYQSLGYTSTRDIILEDGTPRRMFVKKV